MENIGSASDCMSLFVADDSFQGRTDRQGVQIQRKLVREAHQRRLEQTRKMQEAAQKAGFWNKLSRFLGLAAAVTSCIPGVNLGVAAAAGMASGACGLGGAFRERQAALAGIARVKAENAGKAAQGDRDELLQSMQQAVDIEQRMLDRIHRLARSEQLG